jgi:hypothetical protein
LPTPKPHTTSAACSNQQLTKTVACGNYTQIHPHTLIRQQSRNHEQGLRRCEGVASNPQSHVRAKADPGPNYSTLNRTHPYHHARDKRSAKMLAVDEMYVTWKRTSCLSNQQICNCLKQWHKDQGAGRHLREEEDDPRVCGLWRNTPR